MIPFLSYKIQGMDPSALYHIFVEMGPVDQNHWQYRSSQWLPYKDEEEEDNLPGNHFYQHPDSPNTGAHWMDREISFKKLKLTHKKIACKNGSQAPMLLKSLHKYQPRLHIEEISDGKQHMPASSSSTYTFTFPDTEFIAVTAYRNSEIIRLKNQNNLFAFGQSLENVPPDGECNGSTSSPPAFLVSNYPVQVQESSGQDNNSESSTSLQLTQNNRALEWIDPGSCQVVPGSDASLSVGPG
ncbi:T-box transcription factor TBX21-like, partial [Gracilinanus agilis]|uniref:T-box transcription factor TBX21-like n=1 Tax=Gracilinanus agilis TaxID=191870 RepID=UPI001CFCD09C